MTIFRPKVSISIVSHGQAPHVERLLHSLARCVPLEDKEILITLNRPEDVRLPQGVDPARVRIFSNNQPYGFSTNHNRAFGHVTGEYFCILNPDVVFVEDVFDPLIRRLETGQAHIITPLIKGQEGEILDNFRSLPTPADLLKRRLFGIPPVVLPSKGDLIYPDWIAGTFLLMAADTFRSVGGFDERYFLYFEDVDFCCRARLSGYVVAVDVTRYVVHFEQRASRRNLWHFLRHVESACRFFRSPVYRAARTTLR